MNLEAMAASISHEVRQPLATIVANGSAARRLLKNAPPNLGEIDNCLQDITSDAHRAGKVFEGIRALFGRTDGAKELVDLNETALQALRALDPDLSHHGVATDLKLTAELPLVAGHAGQLQEVVVNLVRNAIESMDGIGDGRRLKLRTDRHDRNTVALEVEDSGPGIDPEKLDSIFDAFVTTKAQGMGLGLAICRMIIERHQGQLSALAARPRGAVFRITLPASAAL
jgi:C4-dicarboxylate-specific signal transduction histidine kinase